MKQIIIFFKNLGNCAANAVKHSTT